MMRITSRWLQPSPSRRQNTLIILANLGSPETLTKRGIRVFLKEFLSDRRVINLSRWLWFPILYGVILPLRPAKLLEKYKQVWVYTSLEETDKIKQTLIDELMEEKQYTKRWTICNNNETKMMNNDKCVKEKGLSTLTYETHCLAEKLQTRLSEWDTHISVLAAMRYGSTNSINSVLTQYYRQDVHRKNKNNKKNNSTNNLEPIIKQEKRYDRLIVLPLFPQYSSSTSASVFDAVVQFFACANQRHVPHLHFIRDYATNTTYIKSITHSILVSLCEYYSEQVHQASAKKRTREEFYDVNSESSLAELGKRLTRTRKHSKTSEISNEKVTIECKEDGEENVAIICSYHSLPVEYVQNGDDYDIQCHRTTECIIEELGRQLHCDVRECVLHVYQSKFGNSEWLSPLLTEAMECLPMTENSEGKSNNVNSENLNVQESVVSKKKQKKECFAKKANNMYFARKCVRTCFVVAPGFATDCLETIEEIAQEAKELFIQHGGKHFSYIPALNHSDAHVETLLSVIKEETVLQSKQNVHVTQTLRDNLFTDKDVIVDVGSKACYTVVDGESIRTDITINNISKGDVNENTNTESKPQGTQRDDRV